MKPTPTQRACLQRLADSPCSLTSWQIAAGVPRASWRSIDALLIGGLVKIDRDWTAVGAREMDIYLCVTSEGLAELAARP